MNSRKQPLLTRRGREKSEIGTGTKGVGQRFERAAGAKGAGPDLGGVAKNILVAPVGSLFVETSAGFNRRKQKRTILIEGELEVAWQFVFGGDAAGIDLDDRALRGQQLAKDLTLGRAGKGRNDGRSG